MRRPSPRSSSVSSEKPQGPVETSSAADTARLAERLAAVLRAGDVVELVGDLGVGKTTFVRAAAAALGVEGPVTSPSFAVAQRYAGRVPVVHLDGYRLGPVEGTDADLLADEVGEDAVVFAEWPEGLGAVLPAARLRVELEHLGGDRRLVRFSAADPESLAVVRSLVADSRPGHLDGQSQSGPDGGR